MRFGESRNEVFLMALLFVFLLTALSIIKLVPPKSGLVYEHIPAPTVESVQEEPQ